jgi:hypothetical protein
MAKAPSDLTDSAWLGPYMRDKRSSPSNAPVSRQLRTPAEQKADETSRAAREITEAAAEQRRLDTARLKAARLERDATASGPANPAASPANPAASADGRSSKKSDHGHAPSGHCLRKFTGRDIGR